MNATCYLETSEITTPTTQRHIPKHRNPQLQGKCQGKIRKDGARPALFHISCCSFVICVVVCYLCCSMYCLCVNVYCHRVTTQLQLINISYSLSRKVPHCVGGWMGPRAGLGASISKIRQKFYISNLVFIKLYLSLLLLQDCTIWN